MFFYRDNFLSAEDFTELHELSVRRFPVILREDKEVVKRPDYLVRSRDDQIPPGHTNVPVELLVRYGKIVHKVVDQTYKFLIDDVKVIEPEISAFWFAYMNPNQTIGYHIDGPVHGVPVEKCLTICLYIHKEWREEYGGEIEEDGLKFMPVPNRLAVWSRDIVHRVNEITDKSLNFNRTIFATTWTTKGFSDNV